MIGKSPLRYPGGKSKAVQKLLPHFPNMMKYTHYREPFLGGGSVAIELTKRFPHLNVWVNDLYHPLYNFWLQLKHRPLHLHSMLYDIKTKGDEKESYKEAKQILNDVSVTDLERASAFYIVNKCSFSGLTEAGGFSNSASKDRFTLSSIDNLLGFSKIIQGWTITNLSYENLFPDSHNTFVYMDPPYEIDPTLYGKRGDLHKQFDHNLFAKHCNELKMSMAISYNSDTKVKSRFPNWKQIDFSHNYSIQSNDKYRETQSKKQELLLVNY